ncbi:MAG: hypothetical protein VB093_19730 [Propionicimonas sp.]|nr:hypothetical protein [Propionicimonas sp.]MEA5116991.1 hypothetical protein [Propionicimonas sp.]
MESRRRLAAAMALTLGLVGCGAAGADPDKVFDSAQDAEQYALKYYCKADSAHRDFGMKETITCDDGTIVKVVWDKDGNAASFRLELTS